MIETWKPITDYEFLYSINELGHVRNDLTGRILKPTKGSGGFYQVGLKGYIRKINKIMEDEFFNLNEGETLIHKDGNKKNNALSNLEVVIKAEMYNSKTFGISRCEQSGKYIARISFNRQRYYLGRFDTKAEAQLAYNEKLNQLKHETNIEKI